MELALERFPEDNTPYSRHDYTVSIGNNRIITTSTDNLLTISKWIGDMKKYLHRTNKNKHDHQPLVIGFCAERKVKNRYKKGGVENNPYDILTLCIGPHYCLIVEISDIVETDYNWRKGEYYNIQSDKFPNSLKDLLTDPSTILVGLYIEKVSKKFETDYGFKLVNTVDLRSLALKGLLRDWKEKEKVVEEEQEESWGIKSLLKDEEEEEEEETRRKLRGLKLEKLLNRVVQPELEIRLPPRETIEIWGNDGIDESKVKYTTVEAFGAWKIGTKYLDLIKNNNNA